MQGKFIVLLGAFLLLVSIGQAVECYICDTSCSTTSANCVDGTFNPSGDGVTSYSGCSYCSKFVGYYQGVLSYVRACNMDGSTVNTCAPLDVEPSTGLEGTVCTCSVDLCNSAVSTLVTSTAFTLTLITVLFASKILLQQPFRR